MRRSIIITFGLFLWSTFLPPFSFPQTDELSPEKRTQLDVATARFMAKNNLPGISIAVVENGECECQTRLGLVWRETGAVRNAVRAAASGVHPKEGAVVKRREASAALVLTFFCK